MTKFNSAAGYNLSNNEKPTQKFTEHKLQKTGLSGKLIKNASAFLVMVAMISCVFLVSVSAASAATWTVGDGCDFDEISGALASSDVSDGDILSVSAGEYTMTANVSINRTLTIESADNNPESVVFDMSNFSFLLKGDGITFKNVTIKNTSYGINTQSGGTNACIENCIFDDVHHADGIKLNQTGAVFRNNVLKNTKFTSAISVTANDAVISGNTISGNEGAGSAARVICIKNAANITVKDNVITENTGEGIRIWGSDCSDILVTGNKINKNNKGIVFNESGSNVQVWFNDISGNTAGITGKTAVEPAFSSAEKKSYTYNGKEFTSKLGNFMGSEYKGEDADRNGIGDEPFELLNKTAQDSFPLVASIESYDIGADAGNDDNENDDDETGDDENDNDETGDDETGDSPNTSGSVSLSAEILPLIEFSVSTDKVNFGSIRPGQSSAPQSISVSNAGGCDIVITAEVSDNSDSVYKTGLMIDDSLWSAFRKIVGNDNAEDIALVLNVPRNYSGSANPAGQVIFWAEVSA